MRLGLGASGLAAEEEVAGCEAAGVAGVCAETAGAGGLGVVPEGGAVLSGCCCARQVAAVAAIAARAKIRKRPRIQQIRSMLLQKPQKWPVG
jgi:hypothetical protein